MNFHHFPQHEWSVILVFCGPQRPGVRLACGANRFRIPRHPGRSDWPSELDADACAGYNITTMPEEEQQSDKPAPEPVDRILRVQAHAGSSSSVGVRPRMVRIKGRSHWQYFQDPASGYWIAVNPVLNLTVEEETLPSLYETISEAAIAVFNDLLATGDLEKFLADRGLQPEDPLPAPESGDVDFDLPITTERISPRDLQVAVR